MLINPRQKSTLMFSPSCCYQQLQLICRREFAGMIKPAYSAQISSKDYFSLKFGFDAFNDKTALWAGLEDIHEAGKSLLHISKLCDSSCQTPEQFDNRQTCWFEKRGQLSPMTGKPLKREFKQKQQNKYLNLILIPFPKQADSVFGTCKANIHRDYRALSSSPELSLTDSDTSHLVINVVTRCRRNSLTH